MALTLASASLGFAPAPVVQRASVVMESAADVEALAKKLNPGERRTAAAASAPLQKKRPKMRRR